MSTTIDQKVVEMRFDNQHFETNVKESLSTLDKLKRALNLEQSAQGFEDIGKAANKLKFDGLSSGIEQVGKHFSAMEVVGITALANLTNSAVDAGKRIVDAMTIRAPKDGFAEYELKMGSIQTIMASTGESIETVNKYLNELNEYSDRTIYSFSDMTSNIGKFTNAGVGLKDAVAAIQGVSNVAAVAGANANEASRAMYNFAQALSAGYVKLIDWKSIENANMATVEFKNQLLETAAEIGTVAKTADGYYQVLTANGQGRNMDDVINATKNFNDSLAFQWMTTDVLIGTLNKYSDTTTEIGKKAAKAATEVKTFSQLIDTIKEALGTGWADTWEIVIGNFEEARDMFSEAQVIFGTIIDKSNEARNAVLREWKALGGRDDLIATFKNLFNAAMSYIVPIKEAFQDVFDPITGDRLKSITESIKNFTGAMQLNERGMQLLKEAFTGLFSVLKVGLDIFKALLRIALSVGKALSPVASILLNLAAAAGRTLTNLADIAEILGGRIANRIKLFLDSLAQSKVAKVAIVVLEVAIYGLIVAAKSLMAVLMSLGEYLGSINLDDVVTAIKIAIGVIVVACASAVSAVKSLFSYVSNLAPVKKAIESVGKAFDAVRKLFKDVELPTFSGLKRFLEDSGYLENAFTAVLGTFRYLSTIIPNAIAQFKTNVLTSLVDTFDKLADRIKMVPDKLKSVPGVLWAFSSGVVKAVGHLVTNFDINGLLNIAKALVSVYLMFSAAKMFNGIGEAGEQIAGLAKAIKSRIKANTFTEFAKSVAILAAAVAALSFIDAKKAMASAGVIMGLITYVGLIYTAILKLSKDVNGAKSVFGVGNGMGMAIGLMALCTSIFLVLKALEKLQGISWSDAVDRLKILGSVLGGLTIAAVALNATSGKFTTSSAAMLMLMVTCLQKLSKVLELYNGIDLSTLKNGAVNIAKIGGALTVFLMAIGFATKNADMLGAAALLGVLVIGLNAFVNIINKYNKINIGDMSKGTLALAAVVVALGAAVALMGRWLSGTTFKMAIAAVGMLIGVVLSLKAATEIAQTITETGWMGVLGAVGVIATITTALIFVLNTLNKLTMDKTTIIGLVSFVASLGLSLFMLGQLKLDQAIIAIGSFVTICYIMQALMNTINSLNVNPTNMIALSAFVWGLAAVAVALKFVAQEDMASVINAAVGLSMVVVAIGAACNLASRVMGSPNTWMTVAAIAVALGVASFAIAELSKVPQDQLAGAIVAMGVISVFIGILTKVAGKYGSGSAALAGTIIAIAGALLMLSGAMLVLGQIPTEKLGGVMALFAEMSIILALATGGVVALAKAALGAVPGIAVVLVTLYALVGAFGLFSLELQIFAKAVEMLGPALASAGNGFASFVQSIAGCITFVNDFATVLATSGTAILGFIVKISAGLSILGLGLSVVSPAMVMFAAGLLAVGVAILPVAVGVIGIGAGMLMLANAVVIAGNGLMGMATAVTMLVTSVANVQQYLGSFILVMAVVGSTIINFTALISGALLTIGASAIGSAAGIAILSTALVGFGLTSTVALIPLTALMTEFGLLSAASTIVATALMTISAELLMLTGQTSIINELLKTVLTTGAMLIATMVELSLSFSAVALGLAATVGLLGSLIPAFELELLALNLALAVTNVTAGIGAATMSALAGAFSLFAGSLALANGSLLLVANGLRIVSETIIKMVTGIAQVANSIPAFVAVMLTMTATMALSITVMSAALLELAVSNVAAASTLAMLTFSLSSVTAVALIASGLMALTAANFTMFGMAVDLAATGINALADGLLELGYSFAGMMTSIADSTLQLLIFATTLGLTVGPIALFGSALVTELTALSIALMPLVPAFMTFSGVAAIASGALFTLSAAIISVSTAFVSLGSSMITVGTGLLTLGIGVRGLVMGIVDAITYAVTQIYTMFQVLTGRVEVSGQEVAEAFAYGLLGNSGQMLLAAGQVGSSVAEEFKKSGPELQQAGAYATEGFAVGMTSSTNSAIDAAKRIATSVLSAFQSVLQIASPSRKFIWCGDMIVGGLVHSLDGHKSDVQRAGVGMGSSLLTSFNNFMGIHSDADRFEEAGANCIGGLVHTIGRNLGLISDTGASMGGSLMDGFNGSIANADFGGIKGMINNQLGNIKLDGVLDLSGMSIVGGDLDFYGSMTGAATNSQMADLNKQWNDLVNKRRKVRNTIKNDFKGIYSAQEKAAIQAEERSLTEQIKQVSAEQKKLREQNVKDVKTTNAAIVQSDKAAAKAGGAAKTEKQKELINDERGYWQKLLEIKQNGAERSKYIDMDLADFEKKVSEDAQKLVDDYVSAIESGRDKILNGGGIFKKVEEQDAASIDDMKKNMEAHVNQINEYAINMAQLQDKLKGTKLADVVADMGVDSLNELKAMNHASDDKLQEMVKIYEDGYAKAGAAAIYQLKGMKANIEAELGNMLNMKDLDLDVFMSIYNGSLDSLGEFTNQMIDAGKSTMEGFIKASTDEMMGPGKAELVKGGKVTIDGVERELVPVYKSTGSKWADSAVDGFCETMSSDDVLERMIAAASAATNAAYEGGMEGQDSHSPSKKWAKLGKWAGEGFIGALKSMTGNMADTAKDATSAVVDPLKTAMMRISDVIQSDDTQLVIRPILDLTNVQNGIDSLSGGNIGFDSSIRLANSANRGFGGISTGFSLSDIADVIAGNSTANTFNNTFNIEGGNNDPREIADAVSRRIQQQVERRTAAWA